MIGNIKPLFQRKACKQKFNQKEKFKKYGKEIIIQDYIEENLDSVDIKTALQKYGAIPPDKINEEQVYMDLTGIKDLRSISDKRAMISDIFYSLPPKVRKEFNNNLMTFEENGLHYFENKHNENIKKFSAYKEMLEKQKAEEGKQNDTKK